MSELRDQLESAKAEYRSLKYPGNVAADLARVAPIRVDRSVWTSGRWRAVGGIAAAAAVAWVVLVQVPTNQQPVTGAPSTGGPIWLGQTAPVVGGVYMPGNLSGGQPGGSQMVGFNAPATRPGNTPQAMPTTQPR